MDLKVPKTGRPWRSICAAILNHADAKALAIHGVRKSVGNGANSLFWHDPWVCNIPLKIMFPRLFSLAINQDALVSSYGLWEGFNWIWSFAWKRGLRPHDLAEKSRLDEILHQVFLDQDSNDSLIWAFHKLGQFSTKSFTQELSKLNPPVVSDVIKGVWMGLVPHRIEVFVWLALLGKINTRHKLASMGILPSDQDVCPLCNSFPESSDPLLLHCEVSRLIWGWWMNLWALKWVFPKTLSDAFSQWRLVKKKKKFFQKVWAAAFFIIVWTIWKERNLRIFEASSSSAKDLQDLVLLRIGWWISGWDEGFPYSPSDIQRNPWCLEWEGSKAPASSIIHAPSFIPWSPPLKNVLKWNVDASVDISNSSAAIGGVLRDHGGKFVCLFSSPIPLMEINCAEILTINRAISISIHSSSVRSMCLLLESDSSNAVMWSNNDNGGPWNMKHHLNFIRSSRKKILNIEITYKSRKSNFVADSLAKQGLKRQDEFIAWL
ncbi:uncharacterized protein LOC104894092 [Beta vulgaris subsp. vulgaris]|uniref:uncharacterized protein LOC104894092 n=1 Tax=Beta vulgaris subsp. vulgaris TaxID=3555 RepID=UPI00053F348D|nr:uncharacterized protein LOC104894092 [Beta vulgaris subsp. vulgaris]